MGRATSSSLVWIAIAAAGCGGGPGSDANAEARAVAFQEVGVGAAVALDGSLSSDPEGAPLVYRWLQVLGPDVTGGAGALAGPQPSFTAPDHVSTLLFELRVDDGHGASAPAPVQVNVLEDPTSALWVDGDAGDDAVGDGSRSAPYASIRAALEAAMTAATAPDVYVRARASGRAYFETDAPLEVPSGTSLYGGYHDGWVRDTCLDRTRVIGASTSLHLRGPSLPASISGFDISAYGSASPEAFVAVILAEGCRSELVIEDNVLSAGNVERGRAPAAGTSYGVALVGEPGASALIRDNRILAGDAADGTDGPDGEAGARGADGKDAVDHRGGAGGTSGAPDHAAMSAGGNGGLGGGSLGHDGYAGRKGAGSYGGDGGSGGPDNGSSGKEPVAGGASGHDGAGGGGAGTRSVGTVFTADRGETGEPGEAGSGGGGGGGGQGGITPSGGGGGGGGQGGAGGLGGAGGAGGGASIGIWLVGVDSRVESNVITSGSGGGGGTGGHGATGGGGGAGGAGFNPDYVVAGTGGRGGAGAPGGAGGRGGAGGGGPSFGIFVGPGLAPILTGNTVAAGAGGPGGFDAAPARAGQGGHAFAIFVADPAGGVLPVLSGNTLTAGTGGMGGASDKDGAAGQTNF